MSNANHFKSGASDVHRTLTSFGLAAALLGSAWISSPAIANGAIESNSILDVPAPWDIPTISALSDDPYYADPAFHGGEFIEDAFYANLNSATNYFWGKKIARAANGDIIVAALVKNPNGNQTNTLWNLGLVRYNAAGTQRLQAWTNAGSYSHVNGEYLVYPKSDFADINNIRAIEIIDGRIIVALRIDFGGSDDVDTKLFIVNEDGSNPRIHNIFNVGARAEYVGGMAVYRTSFVGAKPQIMVVASDQPRASQPSGIGRPLFARYQLEGDNSITTQVARMNLNTHWCDNTSRDCRPGGIALGSRGLLQNPSVYVINRYYQADPTQQGWSKAITKIDVNGNADSNWPGLWWYNVDGPSGPHRDWAVDIAVRTVGLGTPESPYVDTVFVASEIDRACGNGVAVARFDSNHNPSGTLIFGGSNTSIISLCDLSGRPTDYPIDMAISGDRLAVVGRGTVNSSTAGAEASEDGWVAILNSGTGSFGLHDFRDYRYPMGGTRSRHSGFYGVVATTAGKFVVTGDNRFTQNEPTATLRGKRSVAILGVASDRIFGHGLE